MVTFRAKPLLPALVLLLGTTATTTDRFDTACESIRTQLEAAASAVAHRRRARETDRVEEGLAGNRERMTFP